MDVPATILVPVDFSSFSKAAIERALEFAKASHGRVRLLHVLALPLISLEYNRSGPVWSDLRSSESAKLESLRREFEDRGVSIAVSFEEGDPPRMIQAAARSADVELIVMGSHGLRGLDRVLIGSVADRTIRGAPAPVLIVREEGSNAAAPVKSILFATDFSDSARKTEDVVARWATQLHAEVEVFHVVPDTTLLFAPYAVPTSRTFNEEVFESSKRRLSGIVQRLRAQGVQAKHEAVVGYASREIVERAKSTGAQVIAMGSRGHSGLRRFRLGSVVQNVLASSPCSVLVGAGPFSSDQD